MLKWTEDESAAFARQQRINMILFVIFCGSALLGTLLLLLK